MTVPAPKDVHGVGVYHGLDRSMANVVLPCASDVKQRDAARKNSHIEGGLCARNDCGVLDFAPQDFHACQPPILIAIESNTLT